MHYIHVTDTGGPGFNVGGKSMFRLNDSELSLTNMQVLQTDTLNLMDFVALPSSNLSYIYSVLIS